MKKALIASALIGLLGASVAFAGPGDKDCGGGHHRGHGGKGGPGMRVEMLKDKLTLTDQQVTEVEKIMQEQRSKMDELRKQMQEQMKANRDESEKRIAALLTPEQTTTYQKMQEERQKRMEERRAEMQKRLDEGKSWF